MINTEPRKRIGEALGWLLAPGPEVQNEDRRAGEVSCEVSMVSSVLRLAKNSCTDIIFKSKSRGMREARHEGETMQFCLQNEEVKDRSCLKKSM